MLLSKRNTPCLEIVVSLLISLSTFSSCKWIGASDKIDPSQQDRLIVEAHIRVPEDDRFELYYRDDQQTYTSENRVEATVSGADSIQQIRFMVEPLVFPSYLRLDLGENREQRPMTIERIVLRYNEASEVFDISEIQKYFRPNRYLDFDLTTMVATPKVVEDAYDPYLDSNNISKFVNNLILH